MGTSGKTTFDGNIDKKMNELKSSADFVSRYPE